MVYRDWNKGHIIKGFNTNFQIDQDDLSSKSRYIFSIQIEEQWDGKVPRKRLKLTQWQKLTKLQI